MPTAEGGATLSIGLGSADLGAPAPQTAAPWPIRRPFVTAAATSPFRARTPLDQLRSLDCLAQAIYYEAASESEEGQRAVAQVVLNRVRHPAWPNSVCGVVYQGAMRAGGGCQFTFTCDGSLAARPQGEAWARARVLAAEALAGRIEPKVGQATHYHTLQVAPTWAPGLVPAALIGHHIFYRLPGDWGRPAAFTARYTGSEPLPRPVITRLRSNLVPASARIAAAPLPAATAAVVLPTATTAATEPAAAEAPPSTVRDEYRNSGQWRDDAPVAITGH